MARPRPPLSAAALALFAACAEPPLLAPPGPDGGAEQLTPPPPPAAPVVTVTGCDGSAVTLGADEKASLDLHNARRAAGALPALCVHPRLLAAARGHSADMLAREYFSHTGPAGETFDQRVARAGYAGWSRLAENIAWGAGVGGAAEAVFERWMNSSGHRANVLSADLREVGIGAAAGTFQGSAGARVWTASFGTRP
jgi:uncharacterized protein YkwD